MRRFRWLAGGKVPAEFDLRRCGWRLVASADGAGAGSPIPVLAEARRLDATRWIELLGNARLASRQRLVLLGVTEPAERARLLRFGFGDVLGCGAHLSELEARVERVRATSECLPRHRQCGGLMLDLSARDGFVSGRRLGLHPREFALLWRLAETPGVAVSRSRLIADVWLMDHRPETNSLAVHVYRLRRKLARAGLPDRIETTREGSYMLVPAHRETAAGAQAFRSRLDERLVSADDAKALAGRMLDE